MEFIQLSKDRYMIKGSNNYIVSKEEKLKLEKKELVLKDIEGCDCQQKTTEKIKEIDKELENAKPKSKHKTIKETKPITE